MTERYKRRQYSLINRSHQYRFLAFILIYNLIIVALLVTFLLLPDIIQLYDQMYDQALSFEVRAAVAGKILSVHSRIWPAIIAVVCVIGMHSFRVFHRFVGPLYRLTRAFGQLRTGDLSFREKQRKKDYLHREEKALNDMLEKLAEKMSGIKSAGQGAMKSLDKLENGINERSSREDTHIETLSDLRRYLNTLMVTVGYFRLQKIEERSGEM